MDYQVTSYNVRQHAVILWKMKKATGIYHMCIKVSSKPARPPPLCWGWLVFIIMGFSSVYTSNAQTAIHTIYLIRICGWMGTKKITPNYEYIPQSLLTPEERPFSKMKTSTYTLCPIGLSTHPTLTWMNETIPNPQSLFLCVCVCNNNKLVDLQNSHCLMSSHRMGSPPMSQQQQHVEMHDRQRQKWNRLHKNTVLQECVNGLHVGLWMGCH